MGVAGRRGGDAKGRRQNLKSQVVELFVPKWDFKAVLKAPLIDVIIMQSVNILTYNLQQNTPKNISLTV